MPHPSCEKTARAMPLAALRPASRCGASKTALSDTAGGTRLSHTALSDTAGGVRLSHMVPRAAGSLCFTLLLRGDALAIGARAGAPPAEREALWGLRDSEKISGRRRSWPSAGIAWTGLPSLRARITVMVQE